MQYAGKKDDTISRHAAIDYCYALINAEHLDNDEMNYAQERVNQTEVILHHLEFMPSAQPEQHEIGYSECANAMLKMWIDNVLTDGEYRRIMDKLNAHWAERRQEE